MRSFLLYVLFLVAPVFSCIAAQSPDLVLHGAINGRQNNSYIAVPFEVPPGTERLTVSFRYTGKEERTTLDLGLEDPHRFRGWSGGNKNTFTISASDATPSYLAGELVPGTWKLWIGVPNIRATSTATYEADIYFAHSAGAQELADGPLRSASGWYRGDFHMHTAHSDGQCNSQSGKKVPCPVFVTVEAAASRHLDFIAVTDHNTTSQFGDLRELQPYFDRLLLIPGREITTFQGHANLYGPTEFVDFRVGSQAVPDMDALLRSARQRGGLFSINHPNAPTGEMCMGCGWRPGIFDVGLVGTVEAVNGGAEEGPYSGIPFWEKELNSGHRLTAIGGSDNHNAQIPPDKVGSIGSPTTVVYASELSVKGIIDGIRSGRVFVDLTGSTDRLLDVTAQTGTATAAMGQVLQAPRGATVEIWAHVSASANSEVRILIDGLQTASIPPAPIASSDQSVRSTWQSDGKSHWLRADIVSDSGKLQLLGNPIYINFPEKRD